MNRNFSDQIAEVHSHFNSGDHSLAQRRLLDSVLETGDQEIYRDCLAYLDWMDESKADSGDSLIIEKALELLSKIERAGVQRSPRHSDELLQVEDVSKQYGSGGFKLQGLNFSLMSRDIIGLVGENGNGKTTLLRLLAAELKPDQGRISYPFLKEVHNDYELRTRLIYIEQRIPRWYGSLMDNLQFAVAYYHSHAASNLLRAEMMIARLGLRPFRHLTWSRLSSGYRTRFELARTLLRNPQILLLDEPLANLDINSQQTILQDLRFMANSISNPFGMLISSQHIYEVEKVSDRIIFIRNGVPRIDPAGMSGTTETEQGLPLILELEVNCTREQLKEALAECGLAQLKYNGGVYIAHLEVGDSAGVLGALSRHRIETLYLRNISQSSRRFFIQ